jgi:hypothetical protein
MFIKIRFHKPHSTANVVVTHETSQHDNIMENCGISSRQKGLQRSEANEIRIYMRQRLGIKRMKQRLLSKKFKVFFHHAVLRMDAATFFVRAIRSFDTRTAKMQHRLVGSS